MNPESVAAPLLPPVGTAILVVYLAILILLGWLGRRAQRETTLSDFYLGGRGLGFLVLLLTLYATQYSGNTLVGFAAKAYRGGFTFLVSVTFMMAIIGVYLVYAPRLQRRSRRFGYITLSDFIQDRFRHRPFSVLISLSGILAMANYITSNFKAIGYAVVSATGGGVGFAEGILWLALVIVIYETLGGLRSVAWTDVLQGIILLTGCLVIFGAIFAHFGGVAGMAGAIRLQRPEFWEPPGFAACILWLSTMIVVALGSAIYPHSIQRIYAARDPKTLRRVLQVMVFLPLFTTFFMLIVGVAGTAQFPGLDSFESEGITLKMLQKLGEGRAAASWIILLFLAAVFAAIMSTIDSALLAISSMITQDLYRPLHPNADQAQLTRFGKRVSWLIMAVMVVLAIYLPQTIWRLIEIKLELLMQIAPALILGLHWRGLRPQAAFRGFVCGTAFTLFFTAGNVFWESIPSKPFGIHAGLSGLLLNLAVLGFHQCRSVR